MESGVILGLQLPVMLAFFGLLAGLVLLARQLHKLRQPAVVRRGAYPPQAHYKGPSHPD
ncbi:MULTISPECIES: hypothetical protein [unclassified Massilia]|uniref:hypothetical protein n=1 Tax=unclassified Massilia TaxID=2609279 RepID=UPI00178048EE|nr:MULTISPECIES: hypothetical protein [unclassified Massilia]MBD8532106.1 hypothetical protein [Massilia sp. CFBP 13647]MBD8675636.1 hypothetical protein [Massilia sp. CFBP 13721]